MSTENQNTTEFVSIINSRSIILISFAFGLLFPIIAWSLDIYTQGLALGIKAIVTIHKYSFLHYLVDSAPFILGLVGWFFGRKICVISSYHKHNNWLHSWFFSSCIVWPITRPCHSKSVEDWFIGYIDVLPQQILF